LKIKSASYFLADNYYPHCDSVETVSAGVTLNYYAIARSVDKRSYQEN